MPNSDQVTASSASQSDNARAVRRVLWIVLWLNLLVFAAKAIYAGISGSLVFSSDAIHSATDAAANVLGLIVLRFAHAPPDSGHPYGHRKLETLASLVIGVAVAFAAVRFAWSAIDALVYGRPPPETHAAGFIIIVLTWVVNLIVATYEARRARQLESPFLAADASHTASDVLVTAGVAAAYGASHFGYAWADPVGSLAITVFVARIAWSIVSRSLPVLIDQAVIDADRVAELARTVEYVNDVHRIRSRGPASSVQLDLHLLLDDPEMPLHQAHDVAHQVEELLRREFPNLTDVTIHVEPDDHYDAL